MRWATRRPSSTRSAPRRRRSTPGLEPVQELVPDALSDLINIPRVAITVIDGVRDDALKALVTPALVNELAKIDAAA